VSVSATSVPTAAADAKAKARPASILNPTIDFLLVGGLSLIVFIPLLLSGRSDLLIIGAGAQAWIATLVNMPHFMASYRIVYRSREMIMRHKWASIYIPAILLLYLLITIASGPASQLFVAIIIAVSSAYLAWHYTGQVWGMMASFTYLEGLSFTKEERLLIRSGLWTLLAWHVVWFLYNMLRPETAVWRMVVRPAYWALTAGMAVAFTLGAIGLSKFRKRTGRLPPVRSLAAWIAIFVWYAVMARDFRALFWIQIAHAVQYLAFPIRVEMNTAGPRNQPRARLALHMAGYAVLLLAASYVVAQVLPASAMSVVADVFGEEPGKATPILLLTFVNIHHYFTDGVVWHISNPEVRKQLFAHVPRPAGESKPKSSAAELTRKKGKR
jgi:hypothetical protein